MIKYRTNKPKDWTGKTVNYLRVIEYAGQRPFYSGRKQHFWRCVCTFRGCGKEVIVPSIQLTRLGGQVSCGCKCRFDFRGRHLKKHFEGKEK